MNDPINLSELIAVKICHDLAGSLGAINNGLELMQDEELTNIHDESLNLVNVSAKEAISKLLYYRQAYGTANSEGETSPDNLRQLATNYFLQNKITLEWHLPSVAPGTNLTIPNSVIKIFLNALLVVASALITGGTIKISIVRSFHKTPIKISGQGNMIKISPDATNMLTKDVDNAIPTIKDLNSYLTAILAKKAGSAIALNFDDKTIDLHIS